MINMVNLPDSMLVKHAYNEYLHIHGQGFNTWFSYVWEIVSMDEFNIETTTSSFRHIVKKHFVNYQKTTIGNVAMNPILRTLKLFKLCFKFETYLEAVKMVVTDTHWQNSEQPPTLSKLSVVNIPIKTGVNERLCNILRN